MIRKVSLVLVILVGLFWVASTFALDYPKKTQAVDNLTNSFRPAFTDAALAQSKLDLATSTTFAADFRTKAAPALAQQLNLTPQQFLTTLATQYPDVGAGLSQLPQILAYFNGVQQTMAAQQKSFHQTDAIPTKNLPNTSVPWLFVLPGILAVVLGAIGFVMRQRVVPLLATLLGIAVIGTTLVISVPAKTRSADRLDEAFRPIFTTASATRAGGYVTVLQAMEEQLTTQALPGLAGLLKVTPQQLSTNLATNFPAVATGLQQLPGIVQRIDVLVTDVRTNIGNFRLADSIPTKGLATTNVEWQFAIPAALLVVAGAAGGIAGERRRRPDPVAVAPHRRHEWSL